MIVVLLGYMASGKSTVGKMLARVLNYEFEDLDTYIESQEQLTIDQIFAQRGEIYFRQKESYYLEQLVDQSENLVVSLGGGTPCFGGNLDLLKKATNVKLIHLKVRPETVVERLKLDQQVRPLVAHITEDEELLTFVRKHLFERNFYYNQAQFNIDVDQKTAKEVIEEILLRLI